MAEQLAGEKGVSVWSLKRRAQLYGQGSAAGGPPGGWRPGGNRRGCAVRENQQRQEMGLALNLLVQTIVWFGFMGAIIFVAAGTIDLGSTALAPAAIVVLMCLQPFTTMLNPVCMHIHSDGS